MPEANVKSQEIRRSYAGQSALDRRAERRERLMNAGLDLFGGLGYAGTSIERLCTAAAVSTRNFYEEFPGREALLMALHDRVMQRAADAVTEALDRTGDAPVAERIAAGFRCYITQTAGDPRWARIGYVEVVGVSPNVERNRAAWRAKCAGILVGEAMRSVASGEAKARDFSLTALAIVGAINELVHHWSLQRDPDELERVIAEVAAIAGARIVGG